MDFGPDSIVVEWKARTSEMHAAMARMRQDSERTRKAMAADAGGGGKGKPEQNEERWRALRFQRWLDADKRYRDRLAADREKEARRAKAVRDKEVKWEADARALTIKERQRTHDEAIQIAKSMATAQQKANNENAAYQIAQMRHVEAEEKKAAAERNRRNEQNAAYQKARMKWEEANTQKLASAERRAAELTVGEQRRVQDEYARSRAFRNKQLQWEQTAADLTVREQRRTQDEHARSVSFRKRTATESGTSIRRTMALQHSMLGVSRAEKSATYELGKAQRWLRGEALRSFRDQLDAARKLHAQRVAEANKITDVKQRELTLIDANNKLAQSYRQISSDARKATTDARLSAGANFLARFKSGFFTLVSWMRAVRYVAWVVMDAYRAVFNVIRTVVNVFVTLAKVWANTVTTALKFGAAVGTAVVGALALATKQSVEFEKSMLRVGGVLGQRIEQMGHLEKAIRGVAKATTIAPSELATGAFQLASFGYGQKATAQMLPGVSALAMAASGETGRVDFERSAELVARMLLVWRRPATEAMKVANMLAAANAYTAATFERLFTGMTKGAQAANLIRMPMEELVGTLSQLNNAGMEGEQAGAALLMMITRLLKPTKEWADAIAPNMQRLGLTMKDINPAAVGLTRAISNLERMGLNPMQLAAFRSRTGLLALNILVQQGAKEHQRLTQMISGTNQAQKQAAIMVSGVSGRWAFFISSLKELAITLTEKIRRPLAWFLDQLGRWVNWLSSTPQVKALADALGQLAWNFARLGVKLLSLIDIRKNWKDFVRAVTSYMGYAARIVTIGVGVIEYAFKSIVDPDSPLRKLWSAFWEFVVWSVNQAGGAVAGAVAAVRKILDNFFGTDMDGMVSRWGETFVALIAETMKQATVVLLRGLAQMSEAIGKWWFNTPFSYLIGPNAGIGLDTTANLLRTIANLTEKEDTTGIVSGAGNAIAKVMRRYGDTRGTVLSGAWTEFKRGRSEFMESANGGVGLPATAAIGNLLASTIRQFADTANNLRQRGDAAAALFDDAAGRIGKLSDQINDMGDDADDAADDLKNAGDRIDGLILKVIGAPLEAIQKYISPVSFGSRVGAGGLGNLLGLGRGNPMQRAADTQVQAATAQLQAANMQLQAVGGFGGAFAGGAASVARSLAARGIGQRRGTRVGGLLPVQGDYFHPGTGRVDVPWAGSQSRVNTGAGGGGDWYRGVRWGSDEHRRMAMEEYNKISREREAITIRNQMAELAPGAPDADIKQMMEGAMGPGGTPASAHRRFQADRERMRRHFGPIRSAMQSYPDSMYSKDSGRQAVDVYVHFDQDTLKPAVNKVVQRGVNQLIPALQGH